jgi:hypothetical protein
MINPPQAFAGRVMRGAHKAGGSLLCYADLKARNPARYLLCPIRQMVTAAMLLCWVMALGINDPV